MNGKRKKEREKEGEARSEHKVCQKFPAHREALVRREDANTDSLSATFNCLKRRGPKVRRVKKYPRVSFSNLLHISSTATVLENGGSAASVLCAHTQFHAAELSPTLRSLNSRFSSCLFYFLRSFALSCDIYWCSVLLGARRQLTCKR